jgi:Excalibur calcium-binding domain
MRFLIPFLLLCTSAHAGNLQDRLDDLRATQVKAAEITIAQQNFSCTGRTCGQMRSCAEACYALLVCGDTRRDGDGDGIPCESLCRSRC